MLYMWRCPAKAHSSALFSRFSDFQPSATSGVSRFSPRFTHVTLGEAASARATRSPLS